MGCRCTCRRCRGFKRLKYLPLSGIILLHQGVCCLALNNPRAYQRQSDFLLIAVHPDKEFGNLSKLPNPFSVLLTHLVYNFLNISHCHEESEAFCIVHRRNPRCNLLLAHCRILFVLNSLCDICHAKTSNNSLLLADLYLSLYHI